MQHQHLNRLSIVNVRDLPVIFRRVILWLRGAKRPSQTYACTRPYVTSSFASACNTNDEDHNAWHKANGDQQYNCCPFETTAPAAAIAPPATTASIAAELAAATAATLIIILIIIKGRLSDGWSSHSLYRWCRFRLLCLFVYFVQHYFDSLFLGPRRCSGSVFTPCRLIVTVIHYLCVRHALCYLSVQTQTIHTIAGCVLEKTKHI